MLPRLDLGKITVKEEAAFALKLSDRYVRECEDVRMDRAKVRAVP